jgi:outer membrane biosynthesis protein TonB
MEIIGADGKVKDVKVVKGLPDGLTLSAGDAVQNWTFRPERTSDGKAVEVRMVVEVSFRLY